MKKKIKAMLLEKIRNDTSLKDFVKETCEENGICVSIDTKISTNEFIVIKVDDYYNSLGLSSTPASVDCLILQRCMKDEYSLTVVELKNIDETRRITAVNLEEKFRNCFNDFMQERFRHYFINDRYYCRIKLFFVSKIDIYGRRNVNESLKLRILREAKIKFLGKTYLIEPQMPTPMIKPC